MFTIYWTFVFLVKKVMLQLSRILCYFQSIIGMLSKSIITKKMRRNFSILSVTLQLFFFKNVLENFGLSYQQCGNLSVPSNKIQIVTWYF